MSFDPKKHWEKIVNRQHEAWLRRNPKQRLTRRSSEVKK